jgi:hypothetical protein
MTLPTLPHSGGTYTRTKKGALQKVAPATPDAAEKPASETPKKDV